MPSTAKDREEQFGKRKAKERFEQTLRGALSTPPKPLKKVPKRSEVKAPRERSGAATEEIWPR
jgi:hypothetical protein